MVGPTTLALNETRHTGGFVHQRPISINPNELQWGANVIDEQQQLAGLAQLAAIGFEIDPRVPVLR